MLVLHAWWGLNDTVKTLCTRLSQAGFVVFAPDLYHGKVATAVADAESLSKALDARHMDAKADIARAATFVAQRASRADCGLAVIGFSLGAYYALDLSAADPEHVRAVVVFYGTGDAEFTHAKAAYLGHFAERDPFEPHANVDVLEAALARSGHAVTFHRYPGTGHWFFEPDRTDAYDPVAARLAWDRTLAFLKHIARSMSPDRRTTPPTRRGER